jgi:hypothetical protein
VSILHQPTDYDGNFTLIYFFMIEKLFLHTTIIINNHFWKTTSFFITITLITHVFKVDRLRIVNKKKILNELFYKEEYMNEIIISIKKKVKSLFLLDKAIFLYSFEVIL